MTHKMLEDLKMRLLSQRDHFILSNKDELPELDQDKIKGPPLLKHASSMLSNLALKRESSLTSGDRKADQSLQPVLTGQSEKRSTAIKHIQRTFEASKEIKVGSQKIDHRGRVVKGVTAVSVKKVVPMAHAELLNLSLVVNDDDLDKATMDAGNLNNG